MNFNRKLFKKIGIYLFNLTLKYFFECYILNYNIKKNSLIHQLPFIILYSINTSIQQ